MNRRIVFLTVCAAALMQAQDRITVPFSDPSRPGLVKASLVQGGITVKAYNGKEVIVQARMGEGREREAPPEARRLKRIPLTSTGLEAAEDNNVVTISTGPLLHPVDLEIQVPVNTSLKLKTVSGGDITVEGVHGEIEASNVSGAVTLKDVAGSAVAHALSGNVRANFTQVDPQKPMAFSSLSGNIDVTFPADLKANVKLKSDNGEIYTDFDVVTRAAPQPAAERAKSGKGRYRVRIDRAVYGTINGGGPEMQFSAFTGSIYIRKK